MLITWAIITIINHWGCESPLPRCEKDNTEGVRPLGSQQDWINSYEDGTVVDHTKPITYTEFINKDGPRTSKLARSWFSLPSTMCNGWGSSSDPAPTVGFLWDTMALSKQYKERSVPSLVDGFKPSQRKVLFCAFKKRLRHDIKVGYISEQSAYHHGEVCPNMSGWRNDNGGRRCVAAMRLVSLENTIVNLAQNFVGSNNTNLLVPSGQFGTRLQGGKDHAAARYIYTRLNHVTRVLFQQDDDHVLSYLEEEGLSIEPQWYCPILPMVLVNGAEGIGVGWSTSIPNYNPRDIIRNIRKMLRGQSMEDMHPWYKACSIGGFCCVQAMESMSFRAFRNGQD
ncbi:unnamed protein product [Cladocopium goreaui]|uniref:DNA topoisomerase (ATP-hydrolyzing) n=1 Tax=Cladocopium goreaui TaxID=2562237 RepID=A0A9P1GMM0_9DINO|nr:unnamed protein product [Cladocopium goreaui]